MKRFRKDGKPIGSLDKKPKNVIESQCYSLLHSLGWNCVTKKGMPDFFCMNEKGKFLLVECKRDGQRLTKAQFLLFKFLSQHRVPCFYFSPSGGLRPFTILKKRQTSINSLNKES